ncbi:hypothetical protein K0H71_00430 [Bacillus sp. IITD106]|nr:hypothetical protein [Bacillus sp. IITD106]
MNTILFNSIKDALKQPKSKHFWISSYNGRYQYGDKESFFGKKLPDQYLTFDISNNKVLANVNSNGSISNLTIYRGCYFSDDIPGVWVNKDFSSTGPYSFKIKIEESVYDLEDLAWRRTTSLLDNIFPITEIESEEIKVTLITYTPISSDGKQRLRGVIYGLYLENKSGMEIKGEVLLPNIGDQEDPFSNTDVSIAIADTHQGSGSGISFDLAPGNGIWVPAVLHAPGEEIMEEINSQGSLKWLLSTWSYFKSITGNLTMPSDPFAEEFFQRAVYQCMGAIGMDGKGDIVGSNWGTFPATKQIWMKDMYYSYLPFYMLETEFFKKGILWFIDRSVRFKSNKFKGGVNFSLSNTLTPIIMCGLYYSSTGDHSFFLENEQINIKTKKILKEVINSRKDKDLWLFSSFWISDAYSLGDYHTGSNVLAWYAFNSYSRILREVYKEFKLADEYKDIANKIKVALDDYNTVEGPFGRQYIEGTSDNKERKTRIPLETYNQEGKDFGMQFIGDLIENDEVNLMMHDGEESDTTLMPMYGYLDYDNQVYRNYAKFSMSEHNPTYNPESRGINWGELSESTFPGYNIGLANIVDSESMSGDEGYLTEIRRLTDIDGSLWWWPYENKGSYGNVVRNQIGKCGWASGVFVGLFISDILGIKYDGPTKTLKFRPFSPSSDFEWKNCKLGITLFNLSFSKKDNRIRVNISNHNEFSINAEIEIPLADDVDLRMITCNKESVSEKNIKTGHFLNKSTVKFTLNIPSGESKEIELLTESKSLSL